MMDKTTYLTAVAPYTGAWIEIIHFKSNGRQYKVAPYTGAWIEITSTSPAGCLVPASLPTRERGLKSCFDAAKMALFAGRSLHGSVD